ncbi:hypothetical protein CLOM_g9752 [Closterium sp. NIES-68]|nr:hypothetical protein CLOM_g9752 [Closterium sp. NIES-68]GJP76744.1 hypothetical protein CLOP_g7208 [Closterium sp. NIES-67]
MDDARISIVAGFIAGVAEVLVGYPFDTVKTRMQSQDRAEPPLLPAHRDRDSDINGCSGQGRAATPGGQHYSSPWSCAVATYRAEGIGGFYRGIAAPMLQEAVGVALLFGTRDWLRTAIGADISRPGVFIVACSIIGLLESLIYCPLDHLKTRIQVRGQRLKHQLLHSTTATSVASQDSSKHSSNTPKTPVISAGLIGGTGHEGTCVSLSLPPSTAYCIGVGPGLLAGKESHADLPPLGMTMGVVMGKDMHGELMGIVSAARSVIRARGVLGLYLGFVLQACKEVLGNIALFATYDVALALFSGTTLVPGGGHGGHLQAGQSWMAIWPAGSLAGMAYYLLGFPFDTIKTRLQTDSLTHPRYRSSFHCTWHMLRHEASFLDLYRGVSACLARAIPGCAVQFFVFEAAHQFISQLGAHIVPSIQPDSSLGISGLGYAGGKPAMDQEKQWDLLAGWS